MKGSKRIELDLKLGDRIARLALQWEDILDGTDPHVLLARLHAQIAAIFKSKIEPVIIKNHDEWITLNQIKAFAQMNDPGFMASFEKWKKENGG